MIVTDCSFMPFFDDVDQSDIAQNNSCHSNLTLALRATEGSFTENPDVIGRWTSCFITIRFNSKRSIAKFYSERNLL
jgi:hypothetical protein